MDSLSQLVLGAACGEAVLGKKIGNKALLWGAIGGTIPDLDVFLNPFFDPVDALFVHRGFSHSLLFPILLSPLLGWIIHRIYSNGPADRLEWIKLFFFSIITHPLLDSMTGYGTALFVPFSDYRVDISSIFIIDPLYTLPFLVCVIAVMLTKRNPAKRSRINTIGLVLSTGYLAFTFFVQQFMQSRFKEELQQKHIEVNRIMTVPTPFNCILWGCIAETDSGYYTGYRSWFDHGATHFVFAGRNEDLIGDLSTDPGIRKLKKFSKGYYVFSKRPDGVYFCDARFGTIGGWADPAAEFVFAFKIGRNPDGTANIQRGEWRTSRMEGLHTLWHRIQGEIPDSVN